MFEPGATVAPGVDAVAYVGLAREAAGRAVAGHDAGRVRAKSEVVLEAVALHRGPPRQRASDISIHSSEAAHGRGHCET